MYPTVTTALATTSTPNDTLVFSCSGLSVVLPMAFTACPGPIVLQPLPAAIPTACLPAYSSPTGIPAAPALLQPMASAGCPMWAGTVTVGLMGAANYTHVSISETCLMGETCGTAITNRVLTCTAPCEIDGQPPVSGEYALAVTTFNLRTGTFFTAPANRWNGYLSPIVVTMPVSSGAGNCGPGTLTTGVTWTQTPWQITISCK